MGNCKLCQSYSRGAKDDDQLTADYYRKQFRGSKVDLEYFHGREFKRPSTIKKLSQVIDDRLNQSDR